LTSLEPRRPDQVNFNLQECDWCERTKWKEWDAKGTPTKIVVSSHFVDTRPSKEDRMLAEKACPEMSRYYASKFPKL